MKKIKVSLKDRSYSILVGRNLLSRAGSFLKPLGLGRKVLVVSNKKIARFYLKPVASSLRKAGFDVSFFLLPFGDERDKSSAVLIRLLRHMAQVPLERSSAVIALGGGVVGDLAAFAASIFMRGISVIQIPTTLLAQVDSAIGGKTAIDLPEAKNITGTFYQPRLVISDVHVLRTQPPSDLKHSFAEVVKYGVIADPALFSMLEKKPEAFYRRLWSGAFGPAELSFFEQVILRSARIKARVVSRDERETGGLRLILNYGHTFAHAFEAASRFKMPHGEAVSIGMVLAAKLSYRLGLCLKTLESRQLELMRKAGLSERPNLKKYGHFQPKQLIFFMKRDKKVRNGKLRFVLPVRIGRVKAVQGISETQVQKLLELFR